MIWSVSFPRGVNLIENFTNFFLYMIRPDGVMRDDLNLMSKLLCHPGFVEGDCTLQDDLDARVASDQWTHTHSLRGTFPHLSEDFKQG